MTRSKFAPLSLSTADPSASLWLRPRSCPVQVELARWADYPHFLETLEQYHAPLPRYMEVKWGAYSDFTRAALDEDAHDHSASLEHIADVAFAMKAGADIPPLVRWGKDIEDGRHRARAGKKIGVQRAPIITFERPVTPVVLDPRCGCWDANQVTPEGTCSRCGGQRGHGQRGVP